MPGISFFADEQDAKPLVERLNADPEIAFLVPDGPLDPREAYGIRLRESVKGQRGETFYFFGPFGVVDNGYRQRWKAVRTVDGLKDGKHALWHVPSGPLPLWTENGTEIIPDPWQGWTERVPGAEPETPYFAGHAAGEVFLELWTRHRPYTEQEKATLPLLNSYWNGSQDLLVNSDLHWFGGRSESPAKRRWWDRLKRWVSRSAVKLSDRRIIFWAFPSAFEKLQGGMAYEARGWELGESIRSAAVPNRPCPSPHL